MLGLSYRREKCAVVWLKPTGGKSVLWSGLSLPELKVCCAWLQPTGVKSVLWLGLSLLFFEPGSCLCMVCLGVPGLRV